MARTIRDVSSIRIDGAIWRAWTKVVVPPHTVRGESPDAKKWMSSVVYRFAFNCIDDTSRSESITYYFDDGSNDFVDASYFPIAWDPVAPDTVWDAGMKCVCGYKP